MARLAVFRCLVQPGSFLLLAAWRWAGSVRWLGWLLLLAFGLRLGLGVSLSFILPTSGYETEVQQAGYNSVDAYNRDLQSWELASSERPILDAFDKSYAVDQYGGLEALSALVYRYLSPDAHRPWLVILMASTMAALGVAFLWQAARMEWNAKLAALAAWIFALYPESLWLGSSQMREPFLLTFIALLVWGLVAWQMRSNNVLQSARNRPRDAVAFRDVVTSWLQASSRNRTRCGSDCSGRASGGRHAPVRVRDRTLHAALRFCRYTATGRPLGARSVLRQAHGA